MDLFNPTSLATGGIIAAVIAFWSQFKNFLSYLSSFFVIQIHLDSVLSESVVMYLKANYKKAPSGLLYYQQIYLALKSKENTNVPFRTISPTTVFYKGMCVLVLNVGSTAKVLTIRGMVNPDQFIVDALTYRNRYYDNQVLAIEKVPRYYVQTISGEEKGQWGSGRSRRTEEPGLVSSAPPPDSSSSTSHLMSPNSNLDASLTHTRDDLAFTQVTNPFEGLFYDEEVRSRIQDALHWRSQKDWYHKRSIPWKRGWMIYGPPGTGKSSLTKSLAKSLNFPLYHYLLSTLSDQEFMRYWDRMNAPCVVLFEDFDTVFDKRQALTEHKSLTFDCVLNQISGVSSHDGIFLVVTTNNLDKIDEAMGVASEHGTISTRPGRIDQLVYLGHTSENVRRQMANHILSDWPEVHDKLVADGKGTTPVQFQELCIQHALSRLNNQKA